jgi:hypothetical protein
MTNRQAETIIFGSSLAAAIFVIAWIGPETRPSLGMNYDNGRWQ